MHKRCGNSNAIDIPCHRTQSMPVETHGQTDHTHDATACQGGIGAPPGGRGDDR